MFSLLRLSYRKQRALVGGPVTWILLNSGHLALAISIYPIQDALYLQGKRDRADDLLAPDLLRIFLHFLNEALLLQVGIKDSYLYVKGGTARHQGR